MNPANIQKLSDTKLSNREDVHKMAAPLTRTKECVEIIVDDTLLLALILTNKTNEQCNEMKLMQN